MKRALLLGECPNPRVVPPSRWESADAFEAFPRSSGFWLREQLRHHGGILAGWEFELENAVTIHRVEHRLSTYDAILALSALVAQRFNLPYVPHPAYWKRFRHSNPLGWLILLRRQLENCK